ncbi:hypothetical protein DL95DRAFT_388917, partial [Leptodontidium sp. 2 PMI_412]
MFVDSSVQHNRWISDTHPPEPSKNSSLARTFDWITRLSQLWKSRFSPIIVPVKHSKPRRERVKMQTI